MRFVTRTAPGVVEFCYAWAPTFIGMNTRLLQEMESRLGEALEGQAITDATLDRAHDLVVAFLLERFPIPGLRDYLDAIKFVQDRPGQEAVAAVPAAGSNEEGTGTWRST